MPKIQPIPLSILILAGGQGSRMGGLDKGLVEFRQQRFIEYMLNIAKPYSDDIMISCNRNQDIYQGYNVALLADEQSDYPGPLAGIQAGLKQAQHQHLLVIPCDTPIIPVDLPQQLFTAALQHPDSICIVNDGQRIQPLHAIIPTALAPDLELFLTGDQRGVMRWYKRHPLTQVLFAGQGELFTNINDAAELEAMAKLSL